MFARHLCMVTMTQNAQHYPKHASAKNRQRLQFLASIDDVYPSLNPHEPYLTEPMIVSNIHRSKSRVEISL